MTEGGETQDWDDKEERRRIGNGRGGRCKLWMRSAEKVSLRTTVKSKKLALHDSGRGGVTSWQNRQTSCYLKQTKQTNYHSKQAKQTNRHSEQTKQNQLSLEADKKNQLSLRAGKTNQLSLRAGKARVESRSMYKNHLPGMA